MPWAALGSLLDSWRVLECFWETHETQRETGGSAIFSHAIFRKAVAMQAWESHEALRATMVSAVFSHAIFRKAVATQAWATHRTLRETGASAVSSHAIFRKAVTMQAWETHETLRETGVSAAFQPRNLQKDSCIASMGNSRNTAGNRHFSSLQLPNLQKRYPGRS